MLVFLMEVYYPQNIQSQVHFYVQHWFSNKSQHVLPGDKNSAYLITVELSHHLFWHLCLTLCMSFQLIFFNPIPPIGVGTINMRAKVRGKTQEWKTNDESHFYKWKHKYGMILAELLLAVVRWCSELLCLCHTYRIRTPPASENGFPVFVAALIWSCTQLHCPKWTVKSFYEGIQAD